MAEVVRKGRFCSKNVQFSKFGSKEVRLPNLVVGFPAGLLNPAFVWLTHQQARIMAAHQTLLPTSQHPACYSCSSANQFHCRHLDFHIFLTSDLSKFLE